MSRKINKILGLGAIAAFGFASSAFAQCPSSPVPPWSSQSATGGSLSIQSGGYDGTSCRLAAAIAAPLSSASATVRDNTPANEPTYRAQFLVNVDALDGINAQSSVRIFNAATETPAMGNANLVQLTVTGNALGTAKLLGVFTACETGAFGRCGTQIPLTGATGGVHRIEVQWVKGASGDAGLKVWVNNTNEASATTTVAANNSAWGGVDFAVLGLSASSTAYRTNFLNAVVGFDEFDSRRTTFIGE